MRGRRCQARRQTYVAEQAVLNKAQQGLNAAGGIVKKLTTHTAGAVLQPGEGQEVKVKVAPYPLQKYPSRLKGRLKGARLDILLAFSACPAAPEFTSTMSHCISCSAGITAKRASLASRTT
jgi:hypothetical protein